MLPDSAKKETPKKLEEAAKVEPPKTVVLDDTRHGKSASPGLRKSAQGLMTDQSMEIPVVGTHEYIPKALNMSHDVNLSPTVKKREEVSQD